MGLIERTLDSGLILAESGGDYASIERQLKKRDPLLELQGWPSETHQCVIWKVVRHAGSHRPPETVLVWQSDLGEPYPLSSGILDKLDRLDKNTRSEWVDADTRNEQRKAELDKQNQRDNQALADDHAFPHGHPVLPRSQSLRLSRDKRRARGEKC